MARPDAGQAPAMALNRPQRWESELSRSNGEYLELPSQLIIELVYLTSRKGRRPEMALLPNARQTRLQGN